jgi:hypothetical protein
MNPLCPSCGRELPQQAIRFCIHCGHDVTVDEQPPARPGPAQPQAPVDYYRGPQHPQPPPYQPQQNRLPRRPRLTVVLVILALVVLAGGGASAALLIHRKDNNSSAISPKTPTTPSTTTSTASSPSPSESAEQVQVSGLATDISRSVAARATVIAATEGVGNCTIAAARGITMMDQAIRQRRAIASQVGALPMSAVANGRQLLADFSNVLALSTSADRDFIGWMQDIRGSSTCPASTATDVSYQAGLRESSRAVTAKNDFLALWNPLASQFGEQMYTSTQI